MNRISEPTPPLPPVTCRDALRSREAGAESDPEGRGEGNLPSPSFPLPGKEGGEPMRARCAHSLTSGFTLIEVLVVVVILGILAGLIVPRIMDRPDQARAVAARNDINAIMNALKLYRLDNGVYPAGDQGLLALVQRPETGNIPRNWKTGGYLERLPKDPWGGDYLYLNPGIQGEVDVVSLGADRQQGGEGYNADIGSWDAN